MKTLVEPIKHTKPTYIIPCQNKYCGAVLEVEEHELRFVGDPRDGDFFQFDCPHCKRYVTIYSPKLQNYLKRLP